MPGAVPNFLESITFMRLIGSIKAHHDLVATRRRRSGALSSALEKAMRCCRKYCFGRTGRAGTQEPQSGDDDEARLFHHADP
jgi:hypothetical protein